MGEPAGIGSEITLKAYRFFLERFRDGDPGFFLIDDPVHVERVVRDLKADIPVTTISDPGDAPAAFSKGLPVLPVYLLGEAPPVESHPGAPQKKTAKVVLASIEQATRLALRGKIAGIVTNPIHKHTLISSGFPFKGHTEFLGSLTQTKEMPKGMARGPVMLLASQELRVSPVTVHIPVSEIAATLNSETIVNVATVVAQSLVRDFGVQEPVLAVCGLNPHAGEGGEIGSEDQDVIAPAIAMLQKKGIKALGPIPADTMFHAEARGRYHAAITMYHDQGLIPIKTIAFHSAVNVTLGLPIVRTSPDHGTGFDIAGKGIARPDSLVQAIILANTIFGRRRAFDARQNENHGQ